MKFSCIMVPMMKKTTEYTGEFVVDPVDWDISTETMGRPIAAQGVNAHLRGDPGSAG